MTAARFFEIVLFAAISFFPYHLLLLHPFQNKLRFSRRITAILLVVFFILDAAGYVYIVLGGSAGLSHAIRVGLAMLFGLIAIKDQPQKIILTVLILSNFYVIINTISTYFEGLIFPEYTMEYYHLSQTICTIPVATIFLYFDALYSVKIYKNVMNQLSDGPVINYLWSIPATFMVIWGTIMFSGDNTDMTAPHNLRTVVLMGIISAGAFFMDYIIALLILEKARIRDHEQRLFEAELMQRQYQNMNKRIEDARRARHDLRHHLGVALTYLNDGRTGELRQYLEEYLATTPNDTVLSFCQNYMANALLTYYKQRCHEREVDYQVEVDFPREMEMDEHDLCIILGNLLENAADAALETELQYREAFVHVKGVCQGGMMMLSVENTYVNKLNMDLNGHYHSTKHFGSGIGLESVKMTAEKYGGCVDVRHDDQVFSVKVMLYL